MYRRDITGLSYEGFDISIYAPHTAHESQVNWAVTIKGIDGQPIAGFNEVAHFVKCVVLAKRFIDEITKRRVR